MTVTSSRSTGTRPRRQRGHVLGATVAHVVLLLFVAFGMLPVLVMVLTSFKPGTEIFRIPAEFWPANPTLGHYIRVFTDSAMPAAMVNSALAAILVTAATLLLGGTAGYAIARIPFRGAGGVSIGLLLGQLLPVTVLLLPVFEIVASLGLIDSIPGVALSHITIVLPLVTWMATTTFRGVPIELEEAAMIDGCTRLRAVWSVVLPVAAPSIASLTIFAFLQSWNEFVFASVITRSLDSKTAPVALTDFAGQFQVDWGATTAAATVISIPLTIVFLFLQRYFIRGMSAGAVKG